MLTKSKISLIRSLNVKKNRTVEGLFVAEGKKLVMDLLKSPLHLHEVYCTDEALPLLNGILHDRITVLRKSEMERISALKSPSDVIALFDIPQYELNREELDIQLSLVLDSIQDPGNLGTIVRLADWFGIKNLICSEDSADLYNPKTVQATMGSLVRVKVHYLPLKDFLSGVRKRNIPVYGTFLEGENIYQTALTANGIVVMGNEGQGISGEIEKLITRKICIPPYPPGGGAVGSESLNVATATAIVIAEFRRRVI